jgi:hypothetical protein
MRLRSIFLFIVFYIIPLAILGYGLAISNIVLDLVGFIWVISALFLNITRETETRS